MEPTHFGGSQPPLSILYETIRGLLTSEEARAVRTLGREIN